MLHSRLSPSRGAFRHRPRCCAISLPPAKLRAAINYGNSVLAQKGPDGAPRGVSADLAAELAKRLGVAVDYVPYEAAGKVFEGAKAGAWDVGFIAIEPVRAQEIIFTAPYVIIEGTYMVPVHSPLKSVDDVDKDGVRMSVGLGSAYDLYLTRTIKHATVLRADAGGGSAMIRKFLDEKLDAAAGVRQQLDAYAKDHPEMRVMSGHFQEIQQAMAMPRIADKPRTAGVALSCRLRRGDEGLGLRRRRPRSAAARSPTSRRPAGK